MRKKVIARKVIDNVIVTINSNDEIRLDIPSAISGTRLQLWKCKNRIEYEQFKIDNINGYLTPSNLYTYCDDFAKQVKQYQ